MRGKYEKQSSPIARGSDLIAHGMLKRTSAHCNGCTAHRTANRNEHVHTHVHTDAHRKTGDEHAHSHVYEHAGNQPDTIG